jgi:hypothetical protein
VEEKSAPNGNNKLLLGILGGTVALFAGSKLFNLAKLQQELQIEQNVTLDPSTGTSGLNAKLKVSIRLKNPTNGSLTLKRPVTTIFFNDSEIGTSDTISDKDYIIPPFGQVDLGPYLITVSMFSASLAALDFFRRLATTKRVVIRARSLTLLNGTIPFEKVSDIELFKK